MRSLAKISCFAALVAAAVVVGPLGRNTPAFNTAEGSDAHYIITNNNYFEAENSGTVLKLGGTKRNPTLTSLKTLETNVSTFGNITTPNIAMIQHGGQACLFLADTEQYGNAISAFQYPGLQLLNNYSNSSVPSSSAGLLLAAREGRLFASYSGYDGNFLSSWTINSDCSLSLLNTISVTGALNSLAVTPNGKTVVSGYTIDNNGLADSFSVGPQGQLAELGPFGGGQHDGMGGVALTADGGYAIFSVEATNNVGDIEDTAVEAFTVDSDSTLSDPQGFGGDGQLGNGRGVPGSLWLSPDERFLFIAATYKNKPQITTTNLSEHPLNITYSGCVKTLRSPKGEPTPLLLNMATVVPHGAGGGLYVAEAYDFSTLGLLSIEPETGCLTEVPGSPYPLSSGGSSLIAWPPRPF